MKPETNIYNKLAEQCPSGYRINEIIPFSYPFRRIRIRATVNKSPEESIQKIYTIMLKTILQGHSSEQELTDFLGLHPEDFILRELYFLKDRGYVHYTEGTWMVTEQGKLFIDDNSILTLLEEEKFEFSLDTVCDQVVAVKMPKGSSQPMENKIPPKIDFKHKSPELLKGKYEQISACYTQQYKQKASLVDYDQSKLLFDKKEFYHYYLVEYIPRNEKMAEPYIEIRNKENHALDRRITNVLSKQYPEILYSFSKSERTSFAQLEEEDLQVLEPFQLKTSLDNHASAIQTLSIWETQEQFEHALKTVEKKLLIESPWIKRATSNYIDLIEQALKRGVVLVILYGLEYNDDHHYPTIKSLEELVYEFRDRFYLIHLPTHFQNIPHRSINGTHRKLLIKDNSYYIQGSFNFLSFNKKKGQKVANEESVRIERHVTKKWEDVFKTYQLERHYPLPN